MTSQHFIHHKFKTYSQSLKSSGYNVVLHITKMEPLVDWSTAAHISFYDRTLKITVIHFKLL